MANTGTFLDEPSRFLGRFLDRRAYTDYAILALMAILPITWAFLIEAHWTLDSYRGYWTKFNWTLQVFLLPLTLFLVRWSLNQIVPVRHSQPSGERPPIVQLVESDDGQLKAYNALRQVIVSRKNLLLALGIATLIHIIDMREVLSFYAGRTDSTGVELDWSLMFLMGQISWWENFSLVVFAYTCQFSLVLMLCLFAIMVARHNIFFLARIYQRRSVAEEDATAYITLDLDDVNHCFGFRVANQAFNIQVLLLALIGMGLLISRFANIDVESGLFRDAGQVLMAVGWLIGLVFVTLPAWVKFLPWMPGRGQLPATTIVDYLREFFPDRKWPYGDQPEPVVVATLTARFADNAFWPTGNNRASVLFFFSFLVLCFLLVPDVGILLSKFAWAEPLVGSPWILAIARLIVFTGLACLLTFALLFLARSWLGYIDKRLIDPPEEAPMTVAELNEFIGAEKEKADVGVFISYRRRDTAGYSGRLKENLEDYIYKKRIFFDLDNIELGVDFVEKIEIGLDSSEVLLAIIGPDWLWSTDENGREQKSGGPKGYVVAEILSAFRRNLPVIPVLVGGTAMPSSSELPEELADLARRNAIEISDSRWSYDVERLWDGISHITSIAASEDATTEVEVQPGRDNADNNE